MAETFEPESRDLFRIRKSPWIFYGIGAGLTVLIYALRLILTPQFEPLWAMLLLAAGGLAAGYVLAGIVKKKVQSSKDYLSMMNGMRFSWIACLVMLLLAGEGNWAYLLASAAVWLCVSFFARYLPGYTQRREAIFRSAHTVK